MKTEQNQFQLVTMAEEVTVSRKIKFGYGLGHILNDLCASMWFTYLLLYFHKVLEFNNTYSGVILFIGQIADGLSTVFVGFSSDRGDNYWLCRKFGRRKSWHLFGTICVLLTFPFIFFHCVSCEDSDQYAQLIYYSGFVIIFQFGWASIQISHLAMIPELSHSSDQRTGLTAIRNAASVLSNITVYIVAWLFLGIRDRAGGNEMIGPSDAASFRDIVLVCLGIGAFSSLFFHLLVPHEDHPSRPPTPPACPDEQVVPRLKMCVRRWLSEPQLYQVAVVYLSTRLFVNLSQAYIPLYLQVTLRLHATSVAKMPLVMFISGLCASLILERTKHLIGRKLVYPIGSTLGIIGCMWIYFGCPDVVCLPESNFASRQTYGIAVFMGASNSIMLVASLSLTADFIGPDVYSSAFIYGFMSLTDKVCNGVAVVLIQTFVPPFTDSCINCRNYFRDVLVWGLGAAAVLGLLALLSLLPSKIGRRRGDVDPDPDSRDLPVNEDATERTPLLCTTAVDA